MYTYIYKYIHTIYIYINDVPPLLRRLACPLCLVTPQELNGGEWKDHPKVPPNQNRHP